MKSKDVDLIQMKEKMRLDQSLFEEENVVQFNKTFLSLMHVKMIKDITKTDLLIEEDLLCILKDQFCEIEDYWW